MGALRRLRRALQVPWGRAAAIGHLDLLAHALGKRGYRCLKLYRAEQFPTRPLLLWVCTPRPDERLKVVMIVHAAPGRTWAYYRIDGPEERHGLLAPCDDPEAAADRIDAVLNGAVRVRHGADGG
ncbi:hypothetical protein [Actinomadura terrae]|uniref:hypothetical protein n=1 Tax=Actinomadura terrae TaxID=604353 RepID=UPI001FA78BFB|nr:hypothetical protein [Actinomadura terrae]